MKILAAFFAYSTAQEEYHGDKEMDNKIILLKIVIICSVRYQKKNSNLVFRLKIENKTQLEIFEKIGADFDTWSEPK